ncbi:hypothetical protein EV715DRAFT_297313 [Schizophyllum commune]
MRSLPRAGVGSTSTYGPSVLHNLEQLDENHQDAIRLLKSAVDAKDWQLCKELIRFLHSIDETGDALRRAMADFGVLDAACLTRRVCQPPYCPLPKVSLLTLRLYEWLVSL